MSGPMTSERSRTTVEWVLRISEVKRLNKELSKVDLSKV